MKKILLFCCCSLLFVSCKKNEIKCSSIKPEQESLQGTWKHQYDASKVEDITLPDEYEYLQFRADSFYVKINHRGDFISLTGCNYLFWSDYVKGKYTLNGTKLLLTGIYTEVDYLTPRLDTCYKRGVYIDSFTASFCKGQLHLEWLHPITYNEYEKHIYLNKQ